MQADPQRNGEARDEQEGEIPQCGSGFGQTKQWDGPAGDQARKDGREKIQQTEHMEAEVTGRSEKAVIGREFRSDERRQYGDHNIAPAGNVCEQSGQMPECVHEQETRTENTKTMDRGKPYRIEGENRTVYSGYPQKAKEKCGRQHDRCQCGSWSLVRSRGKDALSAEHDD